MTRLPLNYLPLNEFHIANCAKMVPFSGYNMPINYNSGIINEHKNVRYQSGVFDVSHMGQILIPNNKSNINNLKKYIPLNLDELQSNKSYYSFLLNNKGGIIDDLILSNITLDNEIFFYIIYNASRKKIDEEILLSCTSDSKILTKNCLFAIQGPNSYEVLNSVIKIPNSMFFLDIHCFDYNSNKILISRSGYTGEDGFEISIPFEISENFLKQLLKNEKVILCGLGARDSLRVEAGLSLYGHELNENITPIEAGLLWAIDKERLKDNSLNGSNHLIRQIDSKLSKKKIGIISVNKSMIREGMSIIDKNKNIIGKVTSGCYSPNLNKSIGLCYINTEFDLNNQLFCEIRNNMELMKETSLPFVKKNYKKNGVNNV